MFISDWGRDDSRDEFQIVAVLRVDERARRGDVYQGLLVAFAVPVGVDERDIGDIDGGVCPSIVSLGSWFQALNEVDESANVLLLLGECGALGGTPLEPSAMGTAADVQGTGLEVVRIGRQIVADLGGLVVESAVDGADLALGERDIDKVRRLGVGFLVTAGKRGVLVNHGQLSSDRVSTDGSDGGVLASASLDMRAYRARAEASKFIHPVHARVYTRYRRSPEKRPLFLADVLLVNGPMVMRANVVILSVFD